MTKSATSIEPGVLDELKQLNADRGPLAGWLEGLERRRQEVSAAVYRRVREDYVKRIEELDRRARPLRTAATRAIASFDEQLAGLANEQREIELDLEELELRYRLDEFPAEEFERRAQGPRARIEALAGELATLRASRELWVAARGEVGSEGPPPQAPETPPAPKTPPAPAADSPHTTQAANATSGGGTAPEPPPPAIAAVPAVPAVAPAPPPAAGATVLSPASITMPRPMAPPRPSSPAIPIAPPADGATRIGQALGPPPVPPAPAPTMAPPPSAPAPPPLDRTVIFTPEPPTDPPSAEGVTQRLLARLIPVDAGDGAAREHPLSPVTTVGRVADNSLQIQQASVSRHHAILRLSADGWTIEDLGAENGTWVNGERVGTRLLADGDRVNIGTVRFVFRKD